MYQKTQLIQNQLALLRCSLSFEKDYYILQEVTKYLAFKPRLDRRSELFPAYDREIGILKLKN